MNINKTKKTNLQRFQHAIGGVVFVELLIVLTHSHEENDSIVVLEVVDPLLSLALLPSHVDDVEYVAVNLEFKL